MSYFFISYDREHIHLAEAVQQKVERAGLACWIDQNMPFGVEWKLTIDTKIKASVAIIVIVTGESLKSGYVTYEWSYALGLGKRVIPLVFESIEKKDMHPKLDDRNYGSFVNSRTRPWTRLVASLREILEDEEIPLEVVNAEQKLYLHDEKERLAAVQFLEEYEHRSSHNALARAVQSRIPSLRPLAAVALARKTNSTDSRALSGLDQALTTYPYEADALRLLVAYNTDQAVGILLKAAMSPKRRLKTSDILDQLVIMESAGVVDALRELLANGVTSMQAITVLGERHDTSAVPLLHDHLRQHANSKWEFRVAILHALGKLRNESSVEVMWEVIELHYPCNY